ncbi:hypothetical protein ACFVWY_08560 [Streptomyces sp. NPDC058195]|uniref:hypothetical protein n=1 Tax=Streptomyces sp. NPDC058195 TaxID=3346375 RepID=UPI0036E271AA
MRADSVAAPRTRARVWPPRYAAGRVDRVADVEVAGVGHGPDPAAPEFGARRVPAEDAHGHTGCFAPGPDSLRAFAAVTEGTAR